MKSEKLVALENELAESWELVSAMRPKVKLLNEKMLVAADAANQFANKKRNMRIYIRLFNGHKSLKSRFDVEMKRMNAATVALVRFERKVEVEIKA